ncbi:hypothetical protein CYY_005141 [Polysphondylium violaceum]|uniref:Uncharacterized protein n=1 Tax=Polysphondylium violaceum TaxID=133409 RepID=A0A8J4Q406_9MYCE|nr:hypothetical protein CYY_005141 [Polysphondylium violaceum]
MSLFAALSKIGNPQTLQNKSFASTSTSNFTQGKNNVALLDAEIDAEVEAGLELIGQAQSRLISDFK